MRKSRATKESTKNWDNRKKVDERDLNKCHQPDLIKLAAIYITSLAHDEDVVSERDIVCTN